MLKTESTIELKHSQDLWLVVFNDLHFGNANSLIGEFKETIHRYKKKNSIFMAIGDIFDSIVMQDIRFQLSQLAGMEDKSILVDDFIDQHVSAFAKIWDSFKIPRERVIGFGLGNHEFQVMKRYGTNLISRFCEACGLNHLGYSGFHTLHLKEPGGERSQNVQIYYHHGYGGGSRTGGYPVTKYEKEMVHHRADIYLFGHDHGKRYLVAYPYLSPAESGNVVYSKNRILGVSGTFMVTKPITEYPGYAEVKGFPPSDLGYLPIKIRLRSIKQNGKSRRYVELKVFE